MENNSYHISQIYGFPNTALCGANVNGYGFVSIDHAFATLQERKNFKACATCIDVLFKVFGDSEDATQNQENQNGKV